MNMNMIVATPEAPFVLDRPFRWREPQDSSTTVTESGNQGHFAAECSLGFAAGDANLYRYCFNSPTNATDASGKAANLVTGAVGAGVGAIFGAGAYLYQYSTGGIDEFSWWDMGAYTLGGAAAGGVAGLTFGASLAFAGGLGLGTVGTTAVAGGMTGVAAGATGGLVTGVGTTADDAWRGDATWGQVGMAGLTGMGRGAFYGGIAGTVGGAAFPIVASLTSGGIAGGFIAGSSSAMLGDFSAQWAGIAVGLQDRYDTGQTAFAGLGGGLLGGYAGYRDPRLSGLVGSRAWQEPIRAITQPRQTAQAVMRNWGNQRGSVSGFREIMRKARAAHGGDLDAAAEIAAAKALRERGMNVHFQNADGWPSGYHGATADLRVGGVRGSGAYGTPYDVYAPTSRSPNRIFSEIRNKNHQAKGVILDLSRTTVAPGDLGNVFARLYGSNARNIQDVIFLP